MLDISNNAKLTYGTLNAEAYSLTKIKPRIKTMNSNIVFLNFTKEVVFIVGCLGAKIRKQNQTPATIQLLFRLFN